MIYEYNIIFKIDEGFDMSECNDLFELIHSGYIVHKLQDEFWVIYPGKQRNVDIELSISKGLEIYGSNIYLIRPNILNDDQFHERFTAYVRFQQELILALYTKNIIGKYMIKTDISALFQLRTLFPIGIKTVPFNMQTTSWVLTSLCKKLDDRGDVETFGKIFENMSTEQFESVYSILFKDIIDIIHEPAPHIIIQTFDHEYKMEFKAAFLHWCNKFAIEANEDTTIGL